MSGLPALGLVAVFAASAVAIWVAGVQVARLTDAIDQRLGIGSAFGGLILLALVTNLPEIAITVTAAMNGDLGLAVGNLLGGIAAQTVVLVILDVASGRDRPLTFVAASLELVLEAVTVIMVVVVAFMGARLPSDTAVFGLSPASVVIVALWFGGLLVVRRAEKGLPWKVETPKGDRGRRSPAKRDGAGPSPLASWPTGRVALAFAFGALVTLVAGVAIEQSGAALAGRIGLSGPVFGATILAAATALPEVSTGLASVRLGDNELAFSDIFGGNAFLPVLFLVADLISGKPALSAAAGTDQWMAGLGAVLTAVYISGLVLRPSRKRFRMGPDSAIVLVLYALGIVGLLFVR